MPMTISSRTIRRGAAALAVAFLAFPAGRARPAERETTARLVSVDVVARDESGRPVTDLSAEDLLVLDEGREERIVAFTGPGAGASSPTTPVALPPDTFTNRIDREVDGSVIAILLDGLNTPQAQQSYARRQVLDFLREIPPGTLVSLYTLGRGVSVLAEFTRDPETLVRALEAHRGEVSAPEASAPLDTSEAGLAVFDSWLEELETNLVEHYARDRALRTIRSLVAIAHHLERVPGRRSLVWVSGSFPAWLGRDSVPRPRRRAPDETTFQAEIERAARALGSSGLAIYPVDARGLRAPVEYDPARSRIDRDMKPMDRSGLATMDTLAARTGGRAFYHSNDLGSAIREAAKDAASACRLGYEPSHDEWNGNFRGIEVRARRPGLRLRHRSGYFAQPREPAEDWYRTAALDAAMWSPIDATRVGLTVRVTPSPPDHVVLDIGVRPDDVTLEPSAEGRQGTLDVWLVQLGEADAHLSTVTSVAEVRLPAGEPEGPAPEGDIAVRTRLKRAAGAARIRVLVRDVPTGALGAVSIPLEDGPGSR